MPSIINSDDGVVSGTSGLKTTGGNDGITTFQQNGTERMRITSAGNVGIGTTSPLGLLQLNSDAGTGEATNRGNLILVNQVGAGPATNTGIEFKGSVSGSGYGAKLYINNNSDYLGIATRFNSATWTERVKISESNGNVTFTNNLSVGDATPTTSGTGITFPATQSASSDANTLDDYEEGTWTPTLFGSTTAGTTTYVSQTGTYTKIGRQVTLQGILNVSAATGTGEWRMGGLPFTATNAGYCVPIVSQLNWGGGTFVVINNLAGSTDCEMYYCGDDATRTNQQMVNEAQLYFFTLTYFV